MSNHREQAIEDFAKATNKPLDFVRGIVDSDCIVHRKAYLSELYAVEQREMVLRLAEALEQVTNSIANSRMGHFGDHTGYTAQFSAQTLERWKAVLSEVQRDHSSTQQKGQES